MPLKDPEARRAYAKKYAEDHQEEAKRRAREWYLTHKDDPEVKKARETHTKKWKEEHKEEWLAWRRKRWAERMQDPMFRATRKRDAAKYRAKKFPVYREAIREAKRVGCCLCPEKDPDALDFHHLDPDTKKYQISLLAKMPTINDLLDEIAKCVVICSNCHRKYHAGKLELPRYM